MKLNIQDNEDMPIMESENISSNSKYKNNRYRIEQKSINVKSLILFTILLIIILFSILYYIFYENNSQLIQTISKLEQKIESMELEIKELNKTTAKKKLKIAFITNSLYGNGIGRFVTVITELLTKTKKYIVYLINENISSHDLPFYKGVKRVVQKKEKKIIEDFDIENDIDIYILNNDVSQFIEIYKSLGKKVIGMFHGVFISCIFTNHTSIYRQWYRFGLFDSFVQVIADDYWIYKNKFNFNNVVYMPNIYTFEHTLIRPSNLTHKNVLIVGRIDDVIKGVKYGVRAMGEVVKSIPDAQLYIVSGTSSKIINNIVNELNIGKNVHFIPFHTNVTDYYLNASVLLVPSVSEAFPMALNEGKAYGLPVVGFNIEYSPPYQNGVITVNEFDYKAMGNEIIKLLKDYNYRKEKGREAKLSLDIYKNNETIETWGELFTSLIKGKDEYQKFQQKIEKKYYNEKIAKERFERHYSYAQQFNKHFRCHSFEQFTNINYLKKIQECQIKDSNLTKTSL